MKLFGPEVAFRRGGSVFLSDLNDGDLATLDANGLFWLPNDDTGRGVIFSRRQLWSFRHTSDMVGSLLSRTEGKGDSFCKTHVMLSETADTACVVHGARRSGGRFRPEKWDRCHHIQCRFLLHR